MFKFEIKEENSEICKGVIHLGPYVGPMSFKYDFESKILTDDDEDRFYLPDITNKYWFGLRDYLKNQARKYELIKEIWSNYESYNLEPKNIRELKIDGDKITYHSFAECCNEYDENGLRLITRNYKGAWCAEKYDISPVWRFQKGCEPLIDELFSLFDENKKEEKEIMKQFEFKVTYESNENIEGTINVRNIISDFSMDLETEALTVSGSSVKHANEISSDQLVDFKNYLLQRLEQYKENKKYVRENQIITTHDGLKFIYRDEQFIEIKIVYSHKEALELISTDNNYVIELNGKKIVACDNDCEDDKIVIIEEK